MKKTNQNLLKLLTAAVALSFVMGGQAATLTDKDKQFLSRYEKIHAALASDDLSTAKNAAKELGEEGSVIATAESLNDARAGFQTLSNRAKTAVAGQSGYHVVHCPMLNKDWVQTSITVTNPYGGKGMVGCGEIQE